jgi:hypothetical protein
MESFHVPMREVEERFTKSEMAIMAWRSNELGYLMHQSMQNSALRAQSSARGVPEAVDYIETDEKLIKLEQRLGPIADKLENKHGEIDLRQLTGPEACRFLNCLGIPIMPGVTRGIK